MGNQRSPAVRATERTALPAANVDRFDYGGGHFQEYGVDLGLGTLTSATLATNFNALMGPELNLEFISVQLAGGMKGTASSYARFLRKILAGGL